MKKGLVVVLVIIVLMLSFSYHRFVYVPKHANDGIDTTIQYLIKDVDSSKISEIDSSLFVNEISKVKYHIIVGSFKNVENAKKLQYIYPNCKILPISDNGFHMVSILEYDNIEDCIKKLKTFRENNGDAWVLKQ